MNRVLKILILIFLIPIYWGIESGCTGLTGGGSTPLGGNFNGAAPATEGTPGGEFRPSGQPTTGIIPGPPPVKFFASLILRSNDNTLYEQCEQFTAKMWQDPKKYGVLYALKKLDGIATDGGGTFEPPTCRNGVKDEDEDCDDNNSGCCTQSCKFKDLNSGCQTQAVPQDGRCTKDHTCVLPPTIKVTVMTTDPKPYPDNPDKPYSYEIPLCPKGPKVVQIEYKVNWDAVVDPNNSLHFRECKTKVDISAEYNKNSTTVYKSPILSGICPSPTQGGECKVKMDLSQTPQADGEIHCEYVKDLGAIINPGTAVKDAAP